jgi:hypothetical protein
MCLEVPKSGICTHPYSGATWVAGEWPRKPHPKDQWLVVDNDGRVLLVSSSPSKKEHTILRFGVTPFDDAGPLPLKLAVRSGWLAFRPLSDADGYTFVLQGKGCLTVDRVRTLVWAPASLGADESELGSP